MHMDNVCTSDTLDKNVCPHEDPLNRQLNYATLKQNHLMVWGH